ncbi:hypothetical protein K437DRAFT_268245 [Tilletiaria anomala UBC 951]|uniref:Uncharacterized protein n=1 Tax=Tilletiaria anomala (strain ATCC 24038 / CBS 436.72 / UBC 951) TaxID=1037660 RepID=A0A066W079_TILAU|nr:uncharacterized protein K437DRAFT_268245 [Tilletiaria anomala UBC 951]KDN45938.1 hypothetical protein K437DRAFT_268245 [Tilletiaria anomala UBC 951]
MYMAKHLPSSSRDMFSNPVFYHNHWRNEEADCAKCLARNSFAGPATGDFWHHRYLQQTVQVYAGNIAETPSSVTISLPQTTVVSDAPNGGTSAQRGPLKDVIEASWNSTVTYDWAQYGEAKAKDLQLMPTTDRTFAFDPASLNFHNSKPARGQPASPEFDWGKSAYAFIATACPFSWNTGKDQEVNETPPKSAADTGTRHDITLVPYAATKLRVDKLAILSSWRNTLL